MSYTRRTFLGVTAGAGALALLPHAAVAQELTVDAVLNDPVAPVRGNPDGDVTIVEFFDYQCPYCKAGHPMLTDVVERDGKVRLVMKDWPIFGAPSLRASQLALGAAELGAYVEVNEALMATEARLSMELIEKTVARVVDPSEAMSAYAANRAKWDGLLDRNSFQATALGFQGTPAFAIDTRLYVGALDRVTLEDAIESARRV